MGRSPLSGAPYAWRVYISMRVKFNVTTSRDCTSHRVPHFMEDVRTVRILARLHIVDYPRTKRGYPRTKRHEQLVDVSAIKLFN